MMDRNPRREATANARRLVDQADPEVSSPVESALLLAQAQALATIALAEGLEELGALLQRHLGGK